MKRLATLLPALLLSLATLASAQDGPRLEVSDSLWQVRLAGGESYTGRIVAVSGDTVTLETITGTRIAFTQAQATRLRRANGTARNGTFWAADPHDSRLFFSPTARTLEQGAGYLGVYELFIPFLAWGPTDRLLLAGGSPFYLGLTGEITPPVYFGPKLQAIRTETFSASLGALGVYVPEDEGDDATFGILYGVGTWGTPDNALTVGLGYGYIEDEMADRPVVMVGGETRVGRYTKLMTENLFVPGEAGVVFAGGVRFFSGRLSGDLGLAGTVGDGWGCCFPLVNVVYGFGPNW